jgi:putative addiction module killer protein
MVYIRQTTVYMTWLNKLRDRGARARIARRMERLRQGNPGDVKPVGRGVSEMRIDYGPGYRVYYKQVGPVVYLLLCAGDKSTQQKDIELALRLAQEEFE